MVDCIAHRCTGWCAVLLALGITSSVLGQIRTSDFATVQADGEYVLDLRPQKVRLQLIARAEGVDVKEALEALKRHEKRVREELLGLKADPDSIRFLPFGEVRQNIVGLPWSLRGMDMDELASRFESIDIQKAPRAFTVKCLVEADWTLDSSDPNVISGLPFALGREVSARDLAGVGNQIDLSPEQRARVEVMQEALDDPADRYDADEQERNSAHGFAFVATVTPEARARAFKAAYEQAHRECKALAEASGHKLGRLVSLTKGKMRYQSGNLWWPAAAAAANDDVLLALRTREIAHNEIVRPWPLVMMERVEVQAVFQLVP